jgi:hypothetical protein
MKPAMYTIVIKIGKEASSANIQADTVSPLPGCQWSYGQTFYIFVVKGIFPAA